MRKFILSLVFIFLITSIFSLGAIADDSDLYEITFDNYNYNNGSTVNVLIKNTSLDEISNWNLSFNLENDTQVLDYWCCNLIQNNNIVTIAPVDWNYTIQPGSTLNIGFTTNTPSDIFSDIILSFDSNNLNSNNSNSNIKSLSEANSKFAFEMFKQINSGESGNNVFYSPLSVSTALTMMYQGADGQTKTEMSDVLNYNNIDMDILNNDYQFLLSTLENVDEFVTLNIGNSIWIDDSFKPKPNFIDINNNYFDAEVLNIDLQSIQTVDLINGWISNETNGLINNMVNESNLSDAIMCLINAIYFQGDWTSPFNSDDTSERSFIKDNNTQTTIDMMMKYDDIEFSKGEDYSAVKLPYGEEKVSMYCVLPTKETSIDTFIQTLTMDKFTEIKDNLTLKSHFYLGLPKFKMEYGTKSIKKQLRDMGMSSAFSLIADFSGISDNSILVSDVLHKAVIEVDEEGTKAAATTVVIVDPTSVDKDNFYANRPFVFLIVDDTTDTILFMGKAADLSK
ncbi:MAG: serpin family protein [Clostridiales bacterium]